MESVQTQIKMKTSVVIISKNNRGYLNNVLHQLFKIRNKHACEIVVVEATDEDDLALDGIKYIKIPPEKAGFGYQRNLGVKNSSGEIILFVDDDVRVTEGWYEKLLAPLSEEKNIAGVMGAVFPYKPSLIGFCEGVLGHPGGGVRLHHHTRNKIHPLSQVATLNTAIKKSYIEAVGMFDENQKYGSEDTDLTIRITKRFGHNQFRYNPDAHVYHIPRNRIDRIIPWYIRRGKADADLFLKHTTHLKYVLSTSILLKIVPFVVLSLVLGNLFIILIPFFLWYFLQLYRYRFMFHYFKYYDFGLLKRVLTFLIFPLIKFLADCMFDLGRVWRFLSSHAK